MALSLRISCIRYETASSDYNIKKNAYPTIYLFQKTNNNKKKCLILKKFISNNISVIFTKRFWKYNINTTTATYEDCNTYNKV